MKINTRIDYSPSAPQTFYVIKSDGYVVPVYFIRYNKTEDPNQDWLFNVGSRYYTDNDKSEGFEFETRDKKYFAVIFIPVEENCITCAEENDPGTITIVVAAKR